MQGWQNFLVPFFLVPGKPRALTLNTQNSSDALLQWNPPIKPNGEITGYQVSARQLPTGKVINKQTKGSTDLWFYGLDKTMTWQFSVMAENIIGVGPSVVVVFDLASGKKTDTLVPEVFFCRKETRQERERSGERKPLVVGDANLTIMLR